MIFSGASGICAYETYNQLKKDGLNVPAWLVQLEFVDRSIPTDYLLVEMFDQNKRSGRALTDALNSILDVVEKHGRPDQLMMPGMEAVRPGAEGIVREGIEKFNDERLAASERKVFSERQENPYTKSALIGKDAENKIYSYDFLIDLPDMPIVKMPNLDSVRVNGAVDKQRIIEEGKKNAVKNGLGRHLDNDTVATTNRYTGREIAITSGGIRHGLEGASGRLLRNSKASIVIGDVVRSAVPINALKPEQAGIDGTYAMVSYIEDASKNQFIAVLHINSRENSVESVDVFDVVYSLNTRQNKDGSRPPIVQAPAQDQVTFHASDTISIKDVINVVNDTFQSILSDNVINAINEKKDPSGNYFNRTVYSARDNTGRALSQEQQEYFKDSKVRDEQGRLLRVYHGTKANFTTFRATDGAYFTASKKVADGFAGGAGSGAYYLDFKTPLVLDAEGNRWDALTAPAEMGRSNAKYKMTPAEEAQYTEFRKLHEALQKLVDDGLSTNDYTKWHENNPRHGELQPSVTKIIQKQAAYEESNSSVIGAEDLVEWAKEQGKYDGVIIKNVREGWASEIISDDYIALHSEQIKSTANLTPTSSPDIRYQKRDTKYLAAVESGDMDTAQKMVDEAAREAGYTTKAY